jgi:hypothetical protein
MSSAPAICASRVTVSWRPGEGAVVQCGEDLPGAVDFEGVEDAASEEQQVGGADHQDRGRGGDRRVAGLVGGVAEAGRPGRRRDQGDHRGAAEPGLGRRGGNGAGGGLVMGSFPLWCSEVVLVVIKSDVSDGWWWW